MNIIKISEEVFETILKNDIMPLDKDHLPSNTTCIAFPYTFFRSPELMIEDSLKEVKRVANENGLTLKKALDGKEKEIEEMKQKIRNYANTDLHVIFNVVNMDITVKHSNFKMIPKSDEILFNAFSFHDVVPIVKIDKMSSNGYWQYRTLMKLVSGVVYAINNREIEVVEESIIKHVSENLYKRDYKNNNVRYITNIKRYDKAFKEHDSTSTRVFSMEAWEVRGHWRHYKNGTKTWVDSYVKGDKEKLGQQDNVYKLNKVNFNFEK